MTPLVLALLLAPYHYSFEPGARLNYQSKIVFDGFIPILGGNEGIVVVEMGVAVEGLEPKKPDLLRAANEITSFKVTFNDAPLPFDVNSVQPYFPRTTVGLTPAGKIQESDAPDVSLPVRLPGLDVKRFPDITYLPVQFPEKELAVGDSWAFTKKFGGSDIAYKCKLESIDGDAAKISVKIKQEYTLLENAALEVVKDEKDAEQRVKTTMTGAGTVSFDTKRGIATRVEMVNDAVSVATSLADKTKTERKLKTTFTLQLNETKPQGPSSQDDGLLGSAWRAVSNTARAVAQTAREWWATARLAVQTALSRVPGLPWFGG